MLARNGTIRKRLTEDEIGFINEQRVLRFNSIMEDEGIHSVPLCFAFDGRSFFVHAKRANAKRWKNVRKNNRVSLELDSYSDDWSRLKGILIQGKAEFLVSGAEHDSGLSLLKEKYQQYGTGPSALAASVTIVRVTPCRVTSWFLEGSSVPRFGAY